MVERRRGQLDLPALGKLAVQRHHLPQNLDVPVKQELLVILGEIAALDLQFLQLGVALEGERVDPGEVEQHLQIAQVALAESSQGLAGGVATRRPPQ